MYSTLFALLYVTGLRISEALALEFDDFDADTLLVRKTKFKKSRRIPLHHTAIAGLQHYFEHRKRVTTEHKLLFISIRGRPLDKSSVGWVFRRLLTTIDIGVGTTRTSTANPRSAPRLRHTGTRNMSGGA